jgi:hypothetical protein
MRGATCPFWKGVCAICMSASAIPTDVLMAKRPNSRATFSPKSPLWPR